MNCGNGSYRLTLNGRRRPARYWKWCAMMGIAGEKGSGLVQAIAARVNADRPHPPDRARFRSEVAQRALGRSEPIQLQRGDRW